MQEKIDSEGDMNMGCKMYILKSENNEWMLVGNESVTSPMPKFFKKFFRLDDALKYLKEDSEKE